MSTSPIARNVQLDVRVWSEREFEAGERQWNDLLRRSEADPLFMSWRWQWCWWQQHAATLHGKLFVLAAYQGDGSLAGIAPFYRRTIRYRGGLSGERIELIGAAFRGPPTIFTEYLDFIVETSQAEAVSKAFAQIIRADRSWCDLVIANALTESLAVRCARDHLWSGHYVRTVDPLTAHAVALPESFQDYLAALKSGVRRKVWNQRSRLRSPELIWIGESEVAECLRLIEKFQAARWGQGNEGEASSDFHADFALDMARQGALRMSILSAEGEPISAMYNVEVNGTEYNLKSGFNPSTSGVSPSYLHFGYCLEQACSRGVRVFDFLGGGGRNRQYKQDFVTKEVTLVTLQIIRSRILGGLYRIHDLANRASGRASQ